MCLLHSSVLVLHCHCLPLSARVSRSQNSCVCNSISSPFKRVFCSYDSDSTVSILVILCIVPCLCNTFFFLHASAIMTLDSPPSPRRPPTFCWWQHKNSKGYDKLVFESFYVRVWFFFFSYSKEKIYIFLVSGLVGLQFYKLFSMYLVA